MSTMLGGDARRGGGGGSRRRILFIAGAVLATVAVVGGYFYVRFGTVGLALAYLRGQHFVVDEPSKSLGDVSVGASRSLSYVVTNVTGSPIRVLGTRVSCTCTTIESIPAVLPVAVPQVIKVRFKPTASQVSARYVAVPRIFTDDSSCPQIKLAFAAQVVPAAAR